MQFREGTPVYTKDGDKVGDIERFVLDPRAKEIIGLIVRKGFLFTEDKVVPIDRVATATEDKVTLDANIQNPDDFPQFEETHYVSPNEDELTNSYRTAFNAPVYYYPPYGTPIRYGPAYTPPQQTVKEQNIPDDTVAVSEGANVMSSDSEHVGDVERVFTDSKTNEVTHFSITQGLFFKEEKTLPIAWVNRVLEDEVYLAVTAKTLENLEENKV